MNMNRDEVIDFFKEEELLPRNEKTGQQNLIADTSFEPWFEGADAPNSWLTKGEK